MSDNVKNAVITIIFVSVLVITMIVNIAKKDGTISISERRKLEQFPSFSIYKLFNGENFSKNLINIQQTSLPTETIWEN